MITAPSYTEDENKIADAVKDLQDQYGVTIRTAANGDFGRVYWEVTSDENPDLFVRFYRERTQPTEMVAWLRDAGLPAFRAKAEDIARAESRI